MKAKYFLGLKCRDLLFLSLLFLPSFVMAKEEPDSTSQDSRKRSNRIALQSALIPGWGQAANHKYWKIPIIYAGFGALVYFIDFNDSKYKQYKSAFLYRNDNDSSTVDEFPNFTTDDIKVRKDFYRRNRDLSYVLSGVLYTLNIIDAYVDAELRNFDISEDLSLQTDPFIFQMGRGETFAGLRLTFTLK